MRALFEFSGFLGLSVAAHLALWQGNPDGAAPAAGAGGAATITLSGGTQTLSALVAEWDRPPEIAPAPLPVVMTVPEEAAPVLAAPAPLAGTAPAIAPLAPVMPGPLAALPEVDLAPPPAPRSALAPEASQRPKPRPDQAETAARPAPKPKPQAAAAPPKQTAAGTGGKAAAGKAGKPGSGAQQAARPSASLMANWGGAIRARVERRKRFPSGAAGQGKVGLWLKVTTAGQLAGAGLTRSSGNPAFDSAALNAVRRAALPRAPGGIAPGAYRFTLSMSFNR